MERLSAITDLRSTQSFVQRAIVAVDNQPGSYSNQKDLKRGLETTLQSTTAKLKAEQQNLSANLGLQNKALASVNRPQVLGTVMAQQSQLRELQRQASSLLSSQGTLYTQSANTDSGSPQNQELESRIQALGTMRAQVLQQQYQIMASGLNLVS